MMNVSPLLDAEQVTRIDQSLKSPAAETELIPILKEMPREVAIHTLRFLALHGVPDDAYAHLLTAWRALLPPPPEVDSVEMREALWHLSEWWDAFDAPTPAQRMRMDNLEDVLCAAGRTAAGVNYFVWVVEHPPYARMDEIWDEHRRGAIMALGQYGSSVLGRSCEVLLCRHLDDWVVLQADVVGILVAFNSRLLSTVAHWYLANDPDLQPFLVEYFG